MAQSQRPPVVAVFGSSTLTERDPAYAEIHALGAALAGRGLVVMTGGYGGAMEAASRGAHEAGGAVIGVTVQLFESRGGANPWVRERVHTPDLYERLRHMVHEADAFIAVTGSIGTLTELFLVWTMLSVGARPAAPLVLMGSHWRAWLAANAAPGFIPERLLRFVEIADTPVATAERVAASLTASRPAAEVRP